MEINLWKIFTDLFKLLFNTFSSLMLPVLFFIIILIFMILFYYIYFVKIKKIKKIKTDVNFNKYKDFNFFNKIFNQFPRQLVYDFLTRNPFDFQEYGIHMICGEQGSGKTITAVWLLQKWKKQYSKLKIFSNSALNFEDGELDHWKELLTNNNGTYGVVNFIDEIHTWFSSNESKELPPEILGEISQQRKQRKAIVGTAQVFGKIAKPLREQTHFVYRPHTFFGCITFVRMANANSYDTEKDKFKKGKGFFFFIHTKELREAYDTYKRISRYHEKNFSRSIIAGTLAPVEQSAAIIE